MSLDGRKFVSFIELDTQRQLAEERANLEEQRANSAEEKAQRLADKLKELGINPDDI